MKTKTMSKFLSPNCARFSKTKPTKIVISSKHYLNSLQMGDLDFIQGDIVKRRFGDKLVSVVG